MAEWLRIERDYFLTEDTKPDIKLIKTSQSWLNKKTSPISLVSFPIKINFLFGTLYNIFPPLSGIFNSMQIYSRI